MKVLVAGSMTHLPGHLATGSVGGFQELGHEVCLHDYLGFRNHAIWKLGNRARLRFGALRSLLYPPKRRGLMRAVLEFQPDLLFVISGEVFDRRTIERIRSLGVRTVMWTGDDPYQKGRELTAAPAYDRVYVFDPYYIKSLKAHGVSKADYLPMACDPRLYRPLQLAEEERRSLGGSVCFVGTWYQNRDETLRALRDFQPQIWGGGWPLALSRPGHPLKAYYRGHAFGEQVTRIYRAHRTVVNIQHPQSHDGQNMRTFEAPACGVLTLTGMTSELPRLFRIGEEIVAYETIDDLRKKLSYYLRHPKEAEQVAQEGMRRALREHTYTERMKKVLAEVA